MKKILTLVAAMTPAFAFADSGLHQHPHGLEYGWVVLALLAGLVGYALARGRK